MADVRLDHPLTLFHLQLHAVMDDFITAKRAERVSRKTIRIYTGELRAFHAYCDSNAVTTLEHITPSILRDYLLDMETRGRNDGGRHLAYRVIKTLLIWCWDEYDLPGQPPTRRVKVKQPRPLPITGVQPDTLTRLLDACNTARDRAILAVLYDTGVRRSELVALNVGDVDIIHGAMDVRRGKGGKSRPVFIERTARKYLRKYLNTRQTTNDDPLFLSERCGRLTVDGLRQMVERVAFRAGVAVPSLHDFRRGSALQLLRHGADAVTVMRLLGHADLKTTLRYLAQSADDLHDVHRRASPLENIDD